MNATKTGEKSEKWLTPPDFASKLPGNPTPETVRGWARRGLIPGAIQSPGGRWQIPASAINDLYPESAS